MPKNLVLLHLESISNTIFWQYRMDLATIWRLSQQSRYYSRFHSNATSTVMACSYFRHGSTFPYDYCSYYQNLGWAECELTPLDTRLQESGFAFGSFRLDSFFHYKQNAAIPNGLIFTTDTANHLVSAAKEFIAKQKQSGTPFYCYFNIDVSHMAMDDRNKLKATTFSDRFRLGYQSINETITQILSFLMEIGQWENTIIVGMGDHGDELWSHDLNKGFCHGTPPYASLTWTPLFIYDNGKDAGVIDSQLVGMTDLHESLTRRLMPEYAPSGNLPPFKTGLFNGINIAEDINHCIFSQNLFALQVEYSDPEKALTKGYSVTDGVYRVVVTSGGKDARKGGMEFYCDRLDPFNSRNLLDFFILDSKGDPQKLSLPADMTSPEIALIFNVEAIDHLKRTYRELKRALYEHIRAKEALALQYQVDKTAPVNLMPEKVFTHIRKRMRRD